MKFKVFSGVFLLVFFVNTVSYAQSYKGIWHGYITIYGNSIPSGYTLHVKQQEGEIITGRAYIYSYQFFLFQGVLDFIGTVKGNVCKVTELSIRDKEFPSPKYSLCIKNLDLTLSNEDKTDYLTGNWKAYYFKNWCEPGKVRLRRYLSEDSNNGSEQIPVQILDMIKADTAPKISFLNTELAKPLILNVKRSTVKIELKDYLKDDFDTVSVYYNRNLIVDKLRLHKKPKAYTIRIEKISGLNEIIMYAINLGRVPPNTSMVTVDDGVNQQNVIISSTKQVSAVIYLKFSPD